MWAFIFIGGVACGWLLPMAWAAYRITRHFMNCMDKRNLKIKEQQREIRNLKLLLLRKKSVDHGANKIHPNEGKLLT